MPVSNYFYAPQTTVPKPFNLGLSKRVEERQQYRSDVDQRQRDDEERAKILSEERAEEESKQLKAYRRSLVHKVRA